MSDISIGDLIAQFGNPKPEPAPEVADAEEWFKGFQDWLASDYERLVHKERKPGLHASALGKVCGRRPLVIAAFGASYVPDTAGNYFTYDMGHALHFWWQERYLGPRQELWGDWKCMACPCPHCETVLDKIVAALNKADKQEVYNNCEHCRGTGRKVTRGLMPMDCACGTPWQDSVRYMELPVEDKELDYVGHCDGILPHKPKRRLFEFKTMSPSEYEKLEKRSAPYKEGPKLEHVVQAHAYMGPLGLDEALIVYVNKGSQCKWTVDRCGQFVAGEPKVTPFIIQWDQALWDGIVARIHDHHRAIKLLNERKAIGKRVSREDITTQPRVCKDMKCDMALRCPVSRECFSLDVPE